MEGHIGPQSCDSVDRVENFALSRHLRVSALRPSAHEQAPLKLVKQLPVHLGRGACDLSVPSSTESIEDQHYLRV